MELVGHITSVLLTDSVFVSSVLLTDSVFEDNNKDLNDKLELAKQDRKPQAELRWRISQLKQQMHQKDTEILDQQNCRRGGMANCCEADGKALW